MELQAHPVSTIPVKSAWEMRAAIAFCAVFVLIRVLMLFGGERNIWWDEAVYLNNAEYISSFGSQAMYEPARPLVLSLLLLLAGDQKQAWGVLIELLLAAGVLLLTYSIARRIVSKPLALWCMVAVALTPSFFNFSGKIMTELPSLFFVLAGLLWLLDEKMFAAGLFMSLGFLTRYFSIFLLAGCMVFWLLENRRDKQVWIRSMKWCTGFFIPIAILGIVFMFFYDTPWYPFELQIWLTKNTGWMYEEGPWFYLVSAVKDNFLYIFTLVGAGALLSSKKHIVLLGAVVYFLIMQLSPHKEVRFLLLMLPLGMILAAYALQMIAPRLQWLWVALLIALFTISLGALKTQELDYANQAWLHFEEMAMEGPVGVTNPLYALGKRVSMVPLYYPTFNSSRLREFYKETDLPATILFSHCDVLCPPADNCAVAEQEFVDATQSRYGAMGSFAASNCTVVFFSSASSAK